MTDADIKVAHADNKMTDADIKAYLNLHAVLQNLEDLIMFDNQMAAVVKGENLSVEFNVIYGPKAHVEFSNGACRVGKGCHISPSIKLLFYSTTHLNKMFDGASFPIPIKGFTKLNFLSTKFTKLTERLKYYLKPDAERLKDEAYLEMNTRLALNTAVHAVSVLGSYDPISKMTAAHMMNGGIVLQVLPDGPAVSLDVRDGQIHAFKNSSKNPMAVMSFKNMGVANALLNNKLDSYSAIAAGDITLKGRLDMLDSINVILDRIPHYLT
jgi:hypothetical protein